ncbi:hypothetical protein CPB84DRAFT_1750659 [Gymnopilus junonius]|uniref:Uncharacterized protein n=1 Tax=Gymnopilus junonius TaxID=109634 RepID=A0A9P5TI40_GYMJU|nr:hypothetical protein CPB84DRAFT_1750659 [Gymnopilus junonius]
MSVTWCRWSRERFGFPSRRVLDAVCCMLRLAWVIARMPGYRQTTVGLVRPLARASLIFNRSSTARTPRVLTWQAQVSAEDALDDACRGLHDFIWLVRRRIGLETTNLRRHRVVVDAHTLMVGTIDDFKSIRHVNIIEPPPSTPSIEFVPSKFQSRIIPRKVLPSSPTMVVPVRPPIPAFPTAPTLAASTSKFIPTFARCLGPTAVPAGGWVERFSTALNNGTEFLLESS